MGAGICFVGVPLIIGERSLVTSSFGSSSKLVTEPLLDVDTLQLELLREEGALYKCAKCWLEIGWLANCGCLCFKATGESLSYSGETWWLNSSSTSGFESAWARAAARCACSLGGDAG